MIIDSPRELKSVLIDQKTPKIFESFKSSKDKKDLLIDSLRRKLEHKNEYIAYLEQRLKK